MLNKLERKVDVLGQELKMLSNKDIYRIRRLKGEIRSLEAMIAYSAQKDYITHEYA